MPYLLTHTYFGYEVQEALPAELRTKEEPMYYLGCVGPDVFFFDRLPPTPFKPHQKEIGNRMHDMPAAELFSALLEHMSDATTPYIEGIICHYALDAATHPYIESQYRGLNHTRFEVSIDMQTYKEHKGVIKLPTMRQQGANIKLVDELMCESAHDLFGEDIPGAYTRSARKFLRIHRLTYDPSGTKRRFLLPIEAVFKKRGVVSGFLMTEDLEDADDCRNLRRRRWAAPWQPRVLRDESFTDLFMAGVREAIELIRLLRAGDREAFLARMQNSSMSCGRLA